MVKWLEYLPEHWQDNLREHLRSKGSRFNEPSIADFTHDLRLTFEDGSYGFFIYAFFIADKGKHEVAVFTEHCGYHIYPFCITRLETIDKYGNVASTESFLIDE